MMKSSNTKEDISKDMLYKETSDGYRVPKKLSVSNVTYNSLNSSPDAMSTSHKQTSQQPLQLKSIVKKTKTKRVIEYMILLK